MHPPSPPPARNDTDASAPRRGPSAGAGTNPANPAHPLDEATAPAPAAAPDPAPGPSPSSGSSPSSATSGSAPATPSGSAATGSAPATPSGSAATGRASATPSGSAPASGPGASDTPAPGVDAPGSRPPSRRADRVYLDAALVSPPHPAAREALLAALDEGWADPRRLHAEGRRARLLLDGAREALAAGIGCRTEELVFTGSHSEAVHAAVLGTVRARHRVGSRVVHSAVEHSAVLHAAAHAGEPVPVGVDHAGRVDLARFTAHLRSPGVALACLQSANGEVATRQPVAEAGAAARAADVPLLVDVAASAPWDRPPQVWDLITADPRAWGAPGGLGLLAVGASARWVSPGPAGDDTERVPGSPSVPLALAAAVSLQAVLAEQAAEGARRRALTARIRAAAAALPDTEVAGDPDDRLPHVVTFSCLYVDGEAVVDELDRAGFAVGSGSACTASTLEPSHVLAAMGVLTHGNVRVGLPRGVGEAEVDAFCAALPGAVARVRAFLGADAL
jgi:cysteine desulfurase